MLDRRIARAHEILVRLDALAQGLPCTSVLVEHRPAFGADQDRVRPDCAMEQIRAVARLQRIEQRPDQAVELFFGERLAARMEMLTQKVAYIQSSSMVATSAAK